MRKRPKVGQWHFQRMHEAYDFREIGVLEILDTSQHPMYRRMSPPSLSPSITHVLIQALRILAKVAIGSQIYMTVYLVELMKAELDMSAGAYLQIKLENARCNSTLEGHIRYYGPFQHLDF